MNVKGLVIGMLILAVITPFIVFNFYHSFGSSYGYPLDTANFNLSAYNVLSEKTAQLSGDLFNKTGGTSGTGDIFETILGGATIALVIFKNIPDMLMTFISSTANAFGLPSWLVILILTIISVSIAFVIISVIMKWRWSDD